MFKTTGGCLLFRKTPHVAFLYPGQARSCVSVVWSLEFEDWEFWPGDFESFPVLDTCDPAPPTRWLPLGFRYLLMMGACMFIIASHPPKVEGLLLHAFTLTLCSDISAPEPGTAPGAG